MVDDVRGRFSDAGNIEETSFAAFGTGVYVVYRVVLKWGVKLGGRPPILFRKPEVEDDCKIPSMPLAKFRNYASYQKASRPRQRSFFVQFPRIQSPAPNLPFPFLFSYDLKSEDAVSSSSLLSSSLSLYRPEDTPK